MADTRICTEPGCGKRHYARGMCQGHYAKWRLTYVRRAGPIGYPAESPPQAYFRETVLLFDGEGCLFWPFGRDKNGYARVNYKGRMMSAGRALCYVRFGPPPSAVHQAAHSCGRGHDGCVNQFHVRWATPKENAADKSIHGTERADFPAEARAARWPGQLTADAVQSIRLDPRRGSIIARDYGVTQSTINNIKKRRIWKALPWPGESEVHR